MNKSASIRQWIIDHPNQDFTAKQIQEELGIYRGTHVSNEIGACMRKRARYMEKAGLKVSHVGKAEKGAYVYRANSIRTRTSLPINDYVISVPINLSTVPTKTLLTEIERRTA